MTPQEQNRGFKGVWIPKDVWLDGNLNALDKVILVEIDSLDNSDGCYASNKYIAEFCQCSESKVSRSIQTLIDLRYVDVISFNGRVRVLKTCLGKLPRQTKQNSEADKAKSLHNNIDNNKDIKTKERKKVESSYDEIVSAMVTEPEVKASIYEFIKMRKMIKKPLTDRALKLVIEQLQKLSDGDKEMAIKILEQSIMNNWLGVFPLKAYSKPVKQKVPSNYDLSWLDAE